MKLERLSNVTLHEQRSRKSNIFFLTSSFMRLRNLFLFLFYIIYFCYREYLLVYSLIIHMLDSTICENSPLNLRVKKINLGKEASFLFLRSKITYFLQEAYSDPKK